MEREGGNAVLVDGRSYCEGTGPLDGLRLEALWTKKRGRGHTQWGAGGTLVGRGSGEASGGGPGQALAPWTVRYDGGEGREHGFFGGDFGTFYAVAGSPGRSDACVRPEPGAPLARPVTWLGGVAPRWAPGSRTPPHHAEAATGAKQQPVPKGVAAAGSRGGSQRGRPSPDVAGARGAARGGRAGGRKQPARAAAASTSSDGEGGSDGSRSGDEDGGDSGGSGSGVPSSPEYQASGSVDDDEEGEEGEGQPGAAAMGVAAAGRQQQRSQQQQGQQQQPQQPQQQQQQQEQQAVPAPRKLRAQAGTDTAATNSHASETAAGEPRAKRQMTEADVAAAGRALGQKVRALQEARPKTQGLGPADLPAAQRGVPSAKLGAKPSPTGRQQREQHHPQEPRAEPQSQLPGQQQQQQQQQPQQGMAEAAGPPKLQPVRQQEAAPPQQPGVAVTRIGGFRRTSASLLMGGRGGRTAPLPPPLARDSSSGDGSSASGVHGQEDSGDEEGRGGMTAEERLEAQRAADTAAAADAAVDAVLAGLTGTGASIKATAAQLLELCCQSDAEVAAGSGARRIVARILARMESVAPGAARVNLLYVTDCLLSHAKREDAPAAALGLPGKAGAGLTRMLQLAVTDAPSLERARRALDALGRKGLLEAGYLRIGAERLDALAQALAASGGGQARGGGGDGGGAGRAGHMAAAGVSREGAGLVDPRLACILLAAPPVRSTEAVLMPALTAREVQRQREAQQQRAAAAAVIAAADAAEAAAEADLARLLRDEDSGSDDSAQQQASSADGVETSQAEQQPQQPPQAQPQQQAQQPQQQAQQPQQQAQQPQQQAQQPQQQQLAQQQPAQGEPAAPGREPCTANLFGPAAQRVYVMDPFGSMAGPGSGGGGGNPGAPLLRQLLSRAALELRPRPDPASAALPDPAEEALADGRAPTWREVLQPRDAAAARDAARAAAVAAQEAEQREELCEEERWIAEQQQRRLQDSGQWASAAAAAAGAEGAAVSGEAAEDDWMFDESAADPREWMAHVPAAPQRDDGPYDEGFAYAAAPSSLPPPWNLQYQSQQGQQQGHPPPALPWVDSRGRSRCSSSNNGGDGAAAYDARRSWPEGAAMAGAFPPPPPSTGGFEAAQPQLPLPPALPPPARATAEVPAAGALRHLPGRPPTAASAPQARRAPYTVSIQESSPPQGQQQPQHHDHWQQQEQHQHQHQQHKAHASSSTPFLPPGFEAALQAPAAKYAQQLWAPGLAVPGAYAHQQQQQQPHLHLAQVDDYGGDDGGSWQHEGDGSPGYGGGGPAYGGAGPYPEAEDDPAVLRPPPMPLASGGLPGVPAPRRPKPASGSGDGGGGLPGVPAPPAPRSGGGLPGVPRPSGR